METMSNIPSKGTKKRVVIVGGGFGGLKLARRLNDRDFQVILLDRNNYHLFQPLLYQVATSGIEPSAISFPFRKIFKRRHDFHVRICTAERVIPQENRLETSIGDVSYDYLVIATGAGTNYFGDQTLAQRTMQLKTTSDALFNRNRMIESFERALHVECRGTETLADVRDCGRWGHGDRVGGCFGRNEEVRVTEGLPGTGLERDADSLGRRGRTVAERFFTEIFGGRYSEFEGYEGRGAVEKVRERV